MLAAYPAANCDESVHDSSSSRCHFPPDARLALRCQAWLPMSSFLAADYTALTNLRQPSVLVNQDDGHAPPEAPRRVAIGHSSGCRRVTASFLRLQFWTATWREISVCRAAPPISCGIVVPSTDRSLRFRRVRRLEAISDSALKFAQPFYPGPLQRHVLFEGFFVWP